MTAPLRAVDARFALPVLPRTAAVLGDLPAWRDGFEAAGVDQVEPAVADVVVAREDQGGAALAIDRPGTIIVGAAGRRPRRRGRRLRSLPADSPRVLVDLDHPIAAAHAVQRLLPAPGRAGAIRNRALAALLRRVPAVVPIGADVTIVSDRTAPPAMLGAMRALGVHDATPWCLGLSSGRTERKCAYFLFGEGGEPDRVLKFKRMPGGDAHFDAVAAGLERARAAGDAVARTAPRLLGRATLQGHPLLLESAMPGVPLQRHLVAGGTTQRKLDLVDRVASWTIQVAVQTGGRGAASTPTVFEHGDLWEENVLVDGPRFSLVDWEESEDAGTPLWDLVYFALHALPLLHGARHDEDRLAGALALARGDHELSGVLRRWVGDYVAAIGLPSDDVGPLIASRWQRWIDEYHSAPAAAAGWFVPRLGRSWLSDADLGASWRGWR